MQAQKGGGGGKWHEETFGTLATPISCGAALIFNQKAIIYENTVLKIFL